MMLNARLSDIIGCELRRLLHRVALIGQNVDDDCSQIRGAICHRGLDLPRRPEPVRSHYGCQTTSKTGHPSRNVEVRLPYTRSYRGRNSASDVLSYTILSHMCGEGMGMFRQPR